MELDIKSLIDYNISPNQFTLLYLILNKRYQEYHKLIKVIGEDYAREELTHLDEKSFINLKDKNNIKAPSSIQIRNKFLFITKTGDFFDELFEEYPTKVVRPEGTKDYLRSDLKRCRKNYLKIAPSRKKHEKILEALRFEKKVRDQENSWKYMKKLPKWLSSEEWETFEERMKDEANINKEKLGYGQELI